jgi:hypothetical protein
MDELDKTIEYERQLATEALSVGAGNVVAFMIIQKLFPKWSAVGQSFAAGILFHLVAEYSGLNDWYLENGAATYIHESKQEYIVIPEKSYKCHQPSFTGYVGQSSWEESSVGLSSCIRYQE